MKQVLMSYDLDLILQGIAQEFNLTRDEVHILYLNLLSEEIKEESITTELNLQITEILKAIGLTEDQDEFEMDSLPALMEASIYNLQSDKELEKIEAIEASRLNEGSAPIDRLDVLEVQAQAYFKNPTRYFQPEEDNEPQVTGYINLYSHTMLDLNGQPVDCYKATGRSFTLPAQEASSLDSIANHVRTCGYELNESIQVKLYGYALYDLVGAKAYAKNEATEFAKYFQEMPNVLLAVPDSQSVCDFYEGIQEALDRMVKEEVIYGRTASEVLDGAYKSWCLNQEFYEIRMPEIEEEELVRAEVTKTSARIEGKTQFRDSFAKEVSIIKSLNGKKSQLSDIAHLTAHELYRILYVCKSQDFSARIESKSVYMQLQSMAHRKSQHEKQPSKEAA